MNQDIQNALLGLFSVCLEVNGAGRLNAHMSYSPHVNCVAVYVLPADTEYQLADRDYRLNEDVYICRNLGGTPQQIVANLNALAGKVREFLLPAHEEAA
ncbi:hypothetical protein MCB86_09015 [Pseudomonas sp. KSR10]|uniref:hypothetical protein n=1 Tax=Pseudomonas sp. KSR10 TaxID=2916654 RepID=UPI001EF93B96|nr:hypothetical protein [Pseudomonas sp. KSR10]MCG6540214.1 hypothetical protein [Pseudomonas sp. KSR10]